MKFLKLKLLAIAAIGFAFSGTANAQDTQIITVTATVPDACLFDVATSQTTMAFDLSGVATAGGPFDQTTTLAWSCSDGFNTVIEIGPGGSGDQLNREMLFGAIPLAYNLYTDGGYGTIWGDGTAPTAAVPIVGTGIGNVGNTTVFGRVTLAAGQAAVPGNYSDVVLVTVVF